MVTTTEWRMARRCVLTDTSELQLVCAVNSGSMWRAAHSAN